METASEVACWAAVIRTGKAATHLGSPVVLATHATLLYHRLQVCSHARRNDSGALSPAGYTDPRRHPCQRRHSGHPTRTRACEEPKGHAGNGAGATDSQGKLRRNGRLDRGRCTCRTTTRLEKEALTGAEPHPSHVAAVMCAP